MFCVPCRSIAAEPAVPGSSRGELPGGFLQSAFRRALAARALRPPHRVLHTRQDWPPLPRCSRAIRGVRFANGDLPSARFRRCSWERRTSPCLLRGNGSQDIPPNNAARVAGPGRIFLSRRGLAGGGEHPGGGRFSPRMAQLPPLLFDFSSPILNREI